MAHSGKNSAKAWNPRAEGKAPHERERGQQHGMYRAGPGRAGGLGRRPARWASCTPYTPLRAERRAEGALIYAFSASFLPIRTPMAEAIISPARPAGGIAEAVQAAHVGVQFFIHLHAVG